MKVKKPRYLIPLIIIILLIIALAVVLITRAIPEGSYEHTIAIEHATDTVLDESQPLELSLTDGTAIIVPPGSLPEGTTISIKKIDPKDALTL